MGEVEIVVKVPEGVPKEVVELVRKSAETKIQKWIRFVRAAEKLKLTEKDLELLEKAREEAWREWREKHGL